MFLSFHCASCKVPLSYCYHLRVRRLVRRAEALVDVVVGYCLVGCRVVDSRQYANVLVLVSGVCRLSAVQEDELIAAVNCYKLVVAFCLAGVDCVI